MVESSEAEKRRILRERRQQKFKNGGASSRLNKITGQEDSNINVKSPIDNKTETVATPRIQPGTKTPSENTVRPEIEVLKKLADSQQQIESTPDILSLLKSLQGSVNGAADTNSSGILGLETDVPKVANPDAAMLEYHNDQVNRLKARTIIVKWLIFLVPYLVLVAKFNASLSNEFLRRLINPSNFSLIFTTFEIVATSVYFQSLRTIQNETKITNIQSSKLLNIAGMIPNGILPINDIQGKLALMMQYKDMITMLLTDLALILIGLWLIHFF